MKLDQKFCTACQQLRTPVGGIFSTSAKNKIKRWMCAVCVAKKNVSIYSSKGKK